MSQQVVDDLYARLEVQPNASAADLRSAYRRLARALHPDHDRSPGAAERFAPVAAAYEILGDPRRRAAYDRERARAAAGAERGVTLPSSVVEPAEALFVGVVDSAASAVDSSLSRGAQRGGFVKRFCFELLRSVTSGARNIAVSEASDLAARVRRPRS